MKLPSARLVFGGLAAACIALLSFGYYLQFFEYLEPCPLCIFQRIAYIVAAAIALVAVLHGPRTAGIRIYAALTVLTVLIGGGIAAWQTYLQHLPADRIPECGPGLEFMLDVYPLADVIKQAFTGSGECAEIDWRFLSLSIAEWSLACFFIFGMIGLLLLARTRLFTGDTP